MASDESLLDVLIDMKHEGTPIPDELLELAKLQDRLGADGLSSPETSRYVEICAALNVLPERFRYLLAQPLSDVKRDPDCDPKRPPP